jgi:alpha-amylase
VTPTLEHSDQLKIGPSCVFYGDLYPNKECYDRGVARDLTLLIQVRQKFAYGPLQDYFYEKNCIGFVRQGDTQHSGCAVVISNREEE